MHIDNAPFDRILVIDFETAWCTKSGYTLSKMTTEEYVRDKRFLAWGLGWKEVGTSMRPVWVSHAEIPDFLASIDWTKTAVAAHNAAFDCAILSWVYGVRPVFVFDSLSMARALRGADAGNSLDALAKAYGLPAKGTALTLSNGILEGPLPPAIEAQLATYCQQDVELGDLILAKLWMRYVPETGEIKGPFPIKELRLIDMTIRMFTEPVFELDAHMLREAIKKEKIEREGLLQRIGIEEANLASNPKFARALESLGVHPPVKTSKTTGKSTFAFAKSDALFQALLNGDREDVALLCEARLKVKSTLERTRAQRLLDVAMRGTLPVPLHFFGAHTGRWSGKGGSLNLQNLKRGSFLRDAIMAPDGYVVVAGDLAQIEPRVVAWLADYTELLELFADPTVDVYAVFGSRMFGIPGMTKETHPLLRQSAKSALIGAGYSLSWANFAAQLLVGFLGAPPLRYDVDFAKQAGVTKRDVERFLAWEPNLVRMNDIPRTCTDEELLVHCVAAKAIITKYREQAWPVVALWELFQSYIVRCLVGGEEVTYKCVTFKKDEIILPSGMSLRYPNCRAGKKVNDRQEYIYGDNTRIYGGKVLENVTQALARIVMSDGMLRVDKRYPVKGTVHDELLCIAREAEAEEATAWVKEKMVQVPPWMPGIPLNAGVGYAKRYGEAKD